MAISKINSKSIEDLQISADDLANGTVTGAKLSYPLTTFSSTGIDDNATSTAITIDSSENVGIGETAPLGKVHIKSGDSGASSVAGDKDELVIENNGHSGITTLASDGSESGMFFGHTSDTRAGEIYTHYTNQLMTIGTRMSGGQVKFISDNGSERMRIGSNGRVGIGTTTLTYALNISESTGNMRIKTTDGQNVANASTSILEYHGTDNRAGYVGFVGGDMVVHTDTYSAGDIKLQTNGSERMRITSAGKALFNTTVTDHGMVVSSGNDTAGNNACYGLVRSGYRSSIGISSTGNMTLKTQDAEIRVEDSAGNNTVVSPHNFDWIPSGASEDLAWSYYSRKGDEENDFDNTKYISADITKVIRKVENLTGDKLIYTGTGNTDDGSTVSQNIIQSLIDRIETLEAKVTALETS